MFVSTSSLIPTCKILLACISISVLRNDASLLTDTKGAYLLFIWITLGCGEVQCGRVSNIVDARTNLLQAIPILVPEDRAVVAETPLMYLKGIHVKVRLLSQASVTHNFLFEIRESYLIYRFLVKE